ncbi:PAS domain S-box protein [Thalassotalea ganghwensis]
MALSDVESNDLRQLFLTSSDYICILDIDGNILSANPYFEENLLAISAHHAGNIFKLAHVDDLDKLKTALFKVNKSATPITLDSRFPLKDNNSLTISWKISADSKKQQFYAIGRDITGKRRELHKLRQIEQVLNKETIIAVTDRRGIITEVNEKFCQISGYNENELLGQNHRILSSGSHDKAFFQQLWKTIAKGNTWSGVIKNRKKSGEYYFVHTIITPLFDMQGRIEHYLAVRFDITEKVAMKKELEKTLNILKETSASAKVGGWELDVESGSLTWTDETFSILEYEKDDSNSPKLSQGLALFTESSKPIIDEAVKRAIEFGEPYELELQALTAKGNIKWVFTNGKANYNGDKVVSLSGTIQDIDAKKLAELKYEQERLKSFHSAKLASLGELSAGVAHEINNPLAIIAGSAQLLRKYLYEPEKLNDVVTRISKSTDRIARIVKSLKKFSRATERSVFEYIPISKIIKEAIILTETKTKRHDVTVVYDNLFDRDIYCDDVEIEQVIVNLINNSVDAIRNLEQRWIKIVTLEEGDELILMVMDSGSGIPEKTKEKLFEPFFTTKRSEGTGLGLSITKGILDEHNATITVDENSNNTCFVIKFKQHWEG